MARIAKEPLHPRRARTAPKQKRDSGRSEAGHEPSPDGRPSEGAPYQRAHSDRGAETRQRLIEAALDVFGRYGFEGATTRQIAKAADVNLAAIVYHFGSKEALHIAVAEHILARVLAHVGPMLEETTRPEATASPEAARATLKSLLGTYVDVMLGTAEAERWARFIVREQMFPSPAFEVIYQLMSNALGRSAALVARAANRPENEEIRATAITLFGQVLVFRVAQALVLRRMGWPSVGDEQRALIKRTVFANVDAIFRPDGGPWDRRGTPSSAGES